MYVFKQRRNFKEESREHRILKYTARIYLYEFDLHYKGPVLKSIVRAYKKLYGAFSRLLLEKFKKDHPKTFEAFYDSIGSETIVLLYPPKKCKNTPASSFRSLAGKGALNNL